MKILIVIFHVQSIDDFISGILTGRSRSIKINIDEFPTLKGDTKKCEVKKSEKSKKAKKEKKEKKPPIKNAVTTLTDSNFDEFVRSQRLPIMVEFYAPWVGFRLHTI